ncbi:hypothetical protein DPMN_056378 [Dreissena polymorpha]|uniref:Uncharacterized protein n=1 Tax=Dreissena polymorpha TaxID=45954 RepID=A0A9D4CTC1_DREPO|nr:hypothetical protein DPMN_056378 [Dreissena polymorpha]
MTTKLSNFVGRYDFSTGHNESTIKMLENEQGKNASHKENMQAAAKARNRNTGISPCLGKSLPPPSKTKSRFLLHIWDRFIFILYPRHSKKGIMRDVVSVAPEQPAHQRSKSLRPTARKPARFTAQSPGFLPARFHAHPPSLPPDHPPTRLLVSMSV